MALIGGKSAGIQRAVMDLTAKLDQLIDNAEQLLTRLADDHRPEVEALRDRVDKAIGETRNAIATRARRANGQLREMAHTVDDYVHDFPWLAVGAGMLVAAALAFLAGVSTRERD